MHTLLVHLRIPGISSFTMSREQSGRLARLLGDGWRVVLCGSQEEFLALLPQADVVSTWTFRQEWFALAPKLRLVSTPAAGEDYLSVEWPSTVEHWNGAFHGTIMAESAVAMILGMARGLLPAVTTFREDPWPRPQLDAIARPVRASRVTICGFGNIGRHAGRILKALDAKIWGISLHAGHSRPDYFTPGDEIYTADHLDELLPHTDHVLLVLPRSSLTNHFLDAYRLALLPSHATLTNLGRGNALDEAALIDALSAHRLAGACLDVMGTEPLPADSPLRTCPNLWLTPHASALSPDYLDLYAGELAERLCNAFPC